MLARAPTCALAGPNLQRQKVIRKDDVKYGLIVISKLNICQNLI